MAYNILKGKEKIKWWCLRLFIQSDTCLKNARLRAGVKPGFVNDWVSGQGPAVSSTKKTLKFVRAEKLQIGAVPRELADVLLGVRSLLKRPDLLSTAAILAAANHFPISVREVRGGELIGVGNTHLAVLLKELVPQTKIQVLVWKDGDALPPHTSRLLGALLFGYELGNPRTFLRLWDQHTRAELGWISPALLTRQGLELVTGISRKLKIDSEEPTLVPGLEAAPLISAGGLEREADRSQPQMAINAGSSVNRRAGCCIRDVHIGETATGLLNGLLIHPSADSNTPNSQRLPGSLCQALDEMGLTINVVDIEVGQECLEPVVSDAFRGALEAVCQQAMAEGDSGRKRLQLVALLIAACLEWIEELGASSIVRHFSPSNNLWTAVSKLSLDTVEHLLPCSPDAEDLLRTIQKTHAELADADTDRSAQRRHLKTLERFWKGFLNAKSQFSLPLAEPKVI
ncbi:hypothetical protein [Marinobacter mobilis]|uniref:hypothetical protein n=1 Tax=Marinobacter mobilis TaxID=488533 RepID=UPI0035C69D24